MTEATSRPPAKTQARFPSSEPVIAVLVPCRNEEGSVGKVVAEFQAALPSAAIYVYDNGSTDETVSRARAAGAIVCSEPLAGKGNVVRRMFADVEADIYVLVDGDGTYDPTTAGLLVAALREGRLDMVNGLRAGDDRAAYRRGHRLGNALFAVMIAKIFGDRVQDVLSGYRVLSRRFVKSFPALATGFEIETELTVHALELRMPMAEIPTHYRARLEGSSSKLSTLRDGIRILRTIVRLVKEERPLAFFAVLALLFAALSLGMAYPVLATYLQAGQVPRLPTAILALGTMLLAFLCLGCGLILDTVTRGRREMKRMQYLRERAPF